MLLETFLAVNSTVIASRTINSNVKEDMKEKILEQGLYHVTSEESTEKIMESGYIKPSSNLASYGRRKCFFFAGTPNYKDLISNVKNNQGFEFKAVKLMPNAEELSSFKQRIWNDDAITYRGKCILPQDRVKVVDLVLDIDEKNNIFMREKTQQELEKGYVPSGKLSQMLEKQDSISVTAKAYINEFKSITSKIKRNFTEFKDKLLGKSNKKLPEAMPEKFQLESPENDSFENDLKGHTYLENEIDYHENSDGIGKDKDGLIKGVNDESNSR